MLPTSLALEPELLVGIPDQAHVAICAIVTCGFFKVISVKQTNAPLIAEHSQLPKQAEDFAALSKKDQRKLKKQKASQDAGHS